MSLACAAALRRNEVLPRALESLQSVARCEEPSAEEVEAARFLEARFRRARARGAAACTRAARIHGGVRLAPRCSDDSAARQQADAPDSATGAVVALIERLVCAAPKPQSRQFLSGGGLEVIRVSAAAWSAVELGALQTRTCNNRRRGRCCCCSRGGCCTRRGLHQRYSCTACP